MRTRGSAFQVFFNEIMTARHPSDFIPTRPWGNEGDRKCDGYLQSQRQLFQVYAPESLMKKQLALKKIDGDFSGAIPYWKDFFDTWTFVHNSDPQSGLPTFMLEKLLLLQNAHKPLICNQWGCSELRNKLFELPEYKIATILPDAPSDISMSKLTLADLQDVLDVIQTQPASPDCDLTEASREKLNYNDLGWYTRDLFQMGLRKTKLVGKYFNDRIWDPTHGDRVAKAFTTRYLELKQEGHSPDAIYWQLQIFAGGDRVCSSDRTSAVTAVLSYLFEKCDIFERVPQQ